MGWWCPGGGRCPHRPSFSNRELGALSGEPGGLPSDTKLADYFNSLAIQYGAYRTSFIVTGC